MANLTTTEVDIGDLCLETGEFQDDTFTAPGAATILKGTILARHSGTGKLIAYVKGGSSNENGIPKAVLPYEVVATGATDYPVRVLVEGKVNKDRLVIYADGDASNIDAAVCDKLRDYKITPVTVGQIDGASYTDEDS